MVFVCKGCGYRFEGKLGYKPKKCPYCSEESIGEEQGAQELLKEVEDLLN